MASPDLVHLLLSERRDCLSQMKRTRGRYGEGKRIDQIDRELQKFAPYPFCRTPSECAGKGYCPKDIACND